MLRALNNFFIGKPPIPPPQRTEVLKYFDDSSAILGLQTQQADIYNSALLIHMNHLDEPNSAQSMVAASQRLALCAKECIRRHDSLFLPEPAAASYAAWNLVLHAYAEWATAQHDAFVAISQGMTPFAERVGQLMAESERLRKKAEQEDLRLLKPMGLNASDIQRIMVAASQAPENAKWEP